MTTAPDPQTELFGAPDDALDDLELGPDARVLRGFALGSAQALLRAVDDVAAAAPLRHMVTARGWSMSVANTNCGRVGWVSDRSGYRYDRVDPASGRPWPALPDVLAAFATEAAAVAGFPAFTPDACLINRYAPGARLSLHQDRDERDFGAPIVSVSLGLPATFLWGGATRAERPRRVRLVHGDVVVWGGTSRLNFHGVDTLRAGTHPLTRDARINLTFRRAL